MLKQQNPTIPLYYVRYRKLLSFLSAGRTLHLFCIGSLLLCVHFLSRLFTMESWSELLLLLPALLFGTLVITTQLDAYSRYQNYKVVKDLMYEHGFRNLLLGPFAHSHCQRDAVREAAKQLNYQEQTRAYFRKIGYHWYHIIPTPIAKNPRLLLTKGYWGTTLFAKHYQSKYFHW